VLEEMKNRVNCREKYMVWLLGKLKKPNPSMLYIIVFTILTGLSLLVWAMFSKEVREYLASYEENHEEILEGN